MKILVYGLTALVFAFVHAGSYKISILLFHRGKSSSVSELVHGNNSVKTPSISHAEDDNMTEEEEESDDVSDRDGMEQALAYKSSQPLHHSQDLYPHQDKQPNSSSDVSRLCYYCVVIVMKASLIQEFSSKNYIYVTEHNILSISVRTITSAKELLAVPHWCANQYDTLYDTRYKDKLASLLMNHIMKASTYGVTPHIRF